MRKNPTEMISVPCGCAIVRDVVTGERIATHYCSEACFESCTDRDKYPDYSIGNRPSPEKIPDLTTGQSSVG